jgi:heme/copper-type cytochrome/quinol oxidase subunit 3
MSRIERPTIDLSALPTTVFGNRDVMWWGTIAFMTIEGFTLVLCAAVYLYLRQNFAAWPPEGMLLPDRVVPTIAVVVMLASLAMMRPLSHAAHDYDIPRVRRWLTALAAVAVLVNGLRAWEITRSLRVRWDANAYGSAAWLVVGAHATLLLIELVELVGMAAIFWLGPVEQKHFSDADDVGFYWVFIVLAWIPLYALCFLMPWVM